MGLTDLLDEAAKGISDAVSTGMSSLAKALDLPDLDGITSPEKAQLVVPGNGGYVYAQYPDGRIVIKSGPKGVKDLAVKPGSTAWKAITKEIGEYSSRAAAESDAASASLPQSPTESDDGSNVTRERYINEFNNKMGQVDAKLAHFQSMASTSADARGEYDRLWTEGQLMYIEYGRVLAEISSRDERAAAAAIGVHMAKIDRLSSELDARLKHAAASSASDTASLKVTVMDSKNRRVQGATVFMPYFGFSQVTSGEGLAEFTNLPAPFSPPIQASISPVAGGSPYFTDEIWVALVAGANDPIQLRFDRSLDELIAGPPSDLTPDDMRDEIARITKRVDEIFDEYDFASTTSGESVP